MYKYGIGKPVERQGRKAKVSTRMYSYDRPAAGIPIAAVWPFLLNFSDWTGSKRKPLSRKSQITFCPSPKPENQNFGAINTLMEAYANEDERAKRESISGT